MKIEYLTVTEKLNCRQIFQSSKCQVTTLRNFLMKLFILRGFSFLQINVSEMINFRTMNKMFLNKQNFQYFR